MRRVTRSYLVGCSKRLVVAAAIVGFGFTTCVASLAEAGNFKGRRYYVKPGDFKGNQALTACDQGFHMASLYEIFDTTNLLYDTNLGAVNPDSGSGPPAETFGWVRTGKNSSSTTGIAETDNCNAWTSDSSSDNGTVVFLDPAWGVNAVGHYNILPWAGVTGPCNAFERVWCVQD